MGPGGTATFVAKNDHLVTVLVIGRVSWHLLLGRGGWLEATLAFKTPVCVCVSGGHQLVSRLNWMSPPWTVPAIVHQQVRIVSGCLLGDFPNASAQCCRPCSCAFLPCAHLSCTTVSTLFAVAYTLLGERRTYR